MNDLFLMRVRHLLLLMIFQLLSLYSVYVHSNGLLFGTGTGSDTGTGAELGHNPGSAIDPAPRASLSPNPSFVPDADNATFRHEIIHFVRAAARHKVSANIMAPLVNLDLKWNNHYQRTNWQVTLNLYYQGRRVGRGVANGNSLAAVLTKATERSLSQFQHGQLSASQLEQYRFEVIFDYFPHQQYAFIEDHQQGLELLGQRVVVRSVTRAALQQQLRRSQAYLLRAMNPSWHGFFKFYYADRDEAETPLRMVYTASSLYTLLKLYAWNHDPLLASYFQPIATFLLSNQIVSGKHADAFYYAFDPVSQTKVCRLVVGTTAKTIFTLLALHQRDSQERHYLAAAKKAGDWLLSMTRPDGQVTAFVDCSKQNETYGDKQSLLYSGQVLSALSRLYAETGAKRYEQGAEKIANYFLRLVQHDGPLLGDNYRPANSISSSWVLMSLLDFSKIHPRNEQTQVIERIARTILTRQINNREDAYNDGRYLDAMTASGNGWINEVMGNLYEFCLKNRPSTQRSPAAHHKRLDPLQDCQQYQQAMILSSRWLLQNAYTPENTFAVKNSARAIGGFITNFNSPTVRTDAVCHGVNGLLALLLHTSDTHTPLLTLNARPFREILPLLRAGIPRPSRINGL